MTLATHKKDHAVFFAIAALVGVCAAFAFSLPHLTEQYREWFVYPALRAHINDKLRDPASTQFRNEHMTALGHLCGELNSKNSMGGYVGFKRFVVGGQRDILLEDHGGLAHPVHQSTAAVLAVLRKQNDLMRIAIHENVRVAPESLRAAAEAAVFDEEWSRRCGR